MKGKNNWSVHFKRNKVLKNIIVKKNVSSLKMYDSKKKTLARVKFIKAYIFKRDDVALRSVTLFQFISKLAKFTNKKHYYTHS